MRARNILINNKLRIVRTPIENHPPMYDGVPSQCYFDRMAEEWYMWLEEWAQLLKLKPINSEFNQKTSKPIVLSFLDRGNTFQRTLITQGQGNPNGKLAGQTGAEYFDADGYWYKCTGRQGWNLISQECDTGEIKNISIISKEPVMTPVKRVDSKVYVGEGNPNGSLEGLIGEVFYDKASKVVYKCSSMVHGKNWMKIGEKKRCPIY